MTELIIGFIGGVVFTSVIAWVSFKDFIQSNFLGGLEVTLSLMNGSSINLHLTDLPKDDQQYAVLKIIRNAEKSQSLIVKEEITYVYTFWKR